MLVGGVRIIPQDSPPPSLGSHKHRTKCDSRNELYTVCYSSERHLFFPTSLSRIPIIRHSMRIDEHAKNEEIGEEKQKNVGY